MSWRRVATLTVMLAGAVIWFNRAVIFGTPLYEDGDMAAMSFGVMEARQGTALYGHMSRYGFFHPGPFFFYVFALLEWILHDLLHLVPAPYNAHVVAIVTLNSLFLALSVCMAEPWMQSRSFLPLGLAVAVVAAGLSGSFCSTWGPHLSLQPFTCLLIACASVAAGEISCVPLAAAVGGVVLQAHIVFLMFVPALWGLALYLCPRRLTRRDLGSAPWLVALFTLPLALDLLLGSHSNAMAVVEHVRAHGTGQHGLLESIDYVARFATYRTRYESTWHPEAINPSLWLGWLAIVLLPSSVRTERYVMFRNAVWWVTGVSAVLMVVWAIVQNGEMLYLNGWFDAGACTALLILATGAVVQRVPQALLAVCAAILGGALVSQLDSFVIATFDDAAHARRPSMVRRLGPGPLYLDIAEEGEAWIAAAGVGLLLERNGTAFDVGPSLRWHWIFRRGHGAARGPGMSAWRIQAGPGTEGVPLGGGCYAVPLPPVP